MSVTEQKIQIIGKAHTGWLYVLQLVIILFISVLPLVETAAGQQQWHTGKGKKDLISIVVPINTWV